MANNKTVEMTKERYGFMKNSKKIIAIVISLFLIATVMSGCSKNGGQDNQTTTVPTTISTTSATTLPTTSATAPTTTQPATSESTAAPTTEYVPVVTDPPTSAAPAVGFPLVNENNGFALTMNADGTFVHSGVYNMDLSAVGMKQTLPISVETTGNYTVNAGTFSLSNTKVIINCTDETVNQLSGVVKMAARALKNVELTDKSTVNVTGGQLVITFIGSNGSQDYTFSTHTFTAEETAGIMAK